MPDEPNSPDPGAPEHYTGPATSSSRALAIHQEPQIQGPAPNAAPTDDIMLPPPIPDTGGDENLMFGWNNEPLESSHHLAEIPQGLS
ncbi:hypothetical protein EDC04DRAFT_2891453 [Pisolithus marmoratus]|nr:hypothetical protein EDC04DRAFT_2891453 [Pisolithus marmoratus]